MRGGACEYVQFNELDIIAIKRNAIKKHESTAVGKLKST